MRPSSVLAAYRSGSRYAKAVGQKFVVSKTRLEGWGWTEDKISALFLAMERIDEMEQVYDAIGRELDERWSAISSNK